MACGRYKVVSDMGVVVGLGSGVEKTNVEGDGKMVMAELEGSRFTGVMLMEMGFD